MRSDALVCCVVILCVPICTAQTPPTPEQVKAAVDKGVAWIAAQQDSTKGCWGCRLNPDETWFPETQALTAMALLKLEHHAVDKKYGSGLPSPFDNGYKYKSNVEKGLAWLLPLGKTMQVSSDADTNTNTFGVFYDNPVTNWHRNYTTSLVLMAVCQSGDLTRRVPATGGPLNNWTYRQVAEDLMNFLAYGQSDTPPYRGGWGYRENSGVFADDPWADNSNSGYVALALSYAEAAPPLGCGLPVPKFVKDEMNLWIGYIQAPDGGSWYDGPLSIVLRATNTLRTGNLLHQMAYVGDTPATQRVQNALAYLRTHWNDQDSDPGWKGWEPGNDTANYQATFTMMKGLTALSVNKFGNPPVDWQADFDTKLLSQQKPEGFWPTCDWDVGPDNQLSTLWALLTLQRTYPNSPPANSLKVGVDIKPGSCPNPFNMKSNGVLPVAVNGTAAFDVRKIDPASVKLEGVPALRWSYEDVASLYQPVPGVTGHVACTTAGADGSLDLSLKFDHEAVAKALKLPVTDREARVVKLTGKLKPEHGGTPVAGEDVIWLLAK